MPSHEDYLDNLLKNVTSGTDNEQEVAMPEDASSEELLSEDAIPEDVIPEELLSGDAIPEDVIPEELLSEDAIPEDAIPEELLSEDAIPEDAIPEELLSGDAISEDVIPEELLSEDAIPEDVIPEDVVLEETLPEETLSDEVNLESILSEEVMPEDVVPDDIMFQGELSDEIVSDAALEGDGIVEVTNEELADAITDLEAAFDVGQNLDGSDLPVQELDTALDTDALLEDAMADLEDVLGPVDDLDIEQMDASVTELADLLEDTVELEEEIEREPVTELNSVPDLETVSTMSEEEIERILTASAEEGLEQEDASEDAEDGLTSEEDLLGMLEGTDDRDLMDIQDMLDKADNNEAVSEEIEALLSEAVMPEQSGESDVTEIEDEKTRRAREKQRKRQEKAAAKKAAKEARAAAKEAKSAAKSAGNAEIASVVAEGISEEPDNSHDSDDLFDSSLLDSIVSEADQAGQKETGEAGDFVDTTLFSGDIEDVESDFGQGNMDAGEAAEEDGSSAADDDMGFDMDSLFGDVDDSGLGDSLGSEADSAFPDFVDLDGQNLDAIMPEVEETGRKKKGLLARFFEMLTEEDEESTSLHLSDENKDILNDLDKEKEAKKKKKKKIKKATAQGDEEDAEGDKAKAKKAKKVKKPKPEKPKKEPEPEPLIPEKKLTVKKVMPVALVCASLGVLIIVFANASVDYTDKKNARDAYYEGDYQTCYENLFGKDLNETEQIMFGTSKSILYMRLWMSEYEMFVEAGEEIEALDNLIQTVNNYPALYDYAVQWNAGEEVMAGYAVILNILSEKYGLTEEQVKEIAAVRSDYKYTEMVVAIVQGKPFGSWGAQVSEETDRNVERTPMPDELPEEGELADGSFISNN